MNLPYFAMAPLVCIPLTPLLPVSLGAMVSRREKEGARVATQFTSPFYLQELAGGLTFPVGAHGFRGPVVWRRLVAGRRGGRKVVFFSLKKTSNFI